MASLSKRQFITIAAAAAAQGLTGAASAETKAGASTPGLRQSRIQEAVVSVFDFERLAAPLLDTGDYDRVELPDAPPEQWKAWHVPKACSRIQQMLLRHRSSSAGQGSIKLVKFHGAPQRVMRSSQRSWDTGGIFDIDVFTHDVTGAYRRLQTFGWTAFGEPVDYRESNLHVRQVVAKGPDGFNVAMIQRYSPPISDVPRFKSWSPYYGGTQMVADFDRAMGYYVKVLGWKAHDQFDIANQAEPGADVLGLPMPQAIAAKRRLAFMRSPDGAGVELISNESMRGQDFAEHCVAPNVGILCVRMPVPDAIGYAAAIKGRGGKLYSEPQAMEIAPYGRVTLFNVRTPEGAILEFYSPA